MIAVCVILALAAFTHLWNLVGFPEIFYDEGVYLRRASNVIQGLGPQEGVYYDHPYFGQLFLAGLYYISGFPSSLGTQANSDSIANLFLVPRLFMAIIAIFDTFVVYKITQKKYGTRIALFASAFFAVMPITWIMRRILLDSILLPFFLLSILFAIYSKDDRRFVLASGVCMGFAIFTKIPVFTMIPLVAYLIYVGTKDKKLIGLWLIPVLILPMIWPAYSILDGNFEQHWLHDVFWQTQRNRIGLLEVTAAFLAMDPILFILGFSGIILAVVNRDRFMLLWSGPYLIFLGLVGFVQYFHWMMMLPVICIGAAQLVRKIGDRSKNPKYDTAPFLGIAMFGLVCTTLVISTNLTMTQFEAAAFSANLVKQNPNSEILANPVYAWAIHNTLRLSSVPKDYSVVLFGKMPSRYVLVSDPHFRRDISRGEQLTEILNSTTPVKSYPDIKTRYDLMSYPYSNLNYCHDAGVIEIRITK